MDGALEVFGWDFRKARGAFLERSVLDRIAGQVAPALDPAPAEMTVGVENKKRLGWRGVHGAIGRGRHQRPTSNVQRSTSNPLVGRRSAEPSNSSARRSLALQFKLRPDRCVIGGL